jgi:hypothetical protein
MARSRSRLNTGRCSSYEPRTKRQRERAGLTIVESSVWRRELTRWILAINWCIAGLACGMVVYGHNYIWGSICRRVAFDEMMAEGVRYPSDNEHWPEWYRRGDQVHAKFTAVDRMGFYGWVIAMCGASGTATGLMIAFPKSPQQHSCQPNNARNSLGNSPE